MRGVGELEVFPDGGVLVGHGPRRRLAAVVLAHQEGEVGLAAVEEAALPATQVQGLPQLVDAEGERGLALFEGGASRKGGGSSRCTYANERCLHVSSVEAQQPFVLLLQLFFFFCFFRFFINWIGQGEKVLNAYICNAFECFRFSKHRHLPDGLMSVSASQLFTGRRIVWLFIDSPFGVKRLNV